MTNKLYFLFVSLLAITISLTAQTYEPLIVSSGFNRDVIAERTPYNSYASSYYYTGDYRFGTQDVIRVTNSSKDITDEQKEAMVATGWPNDNGNPDDRLIRCQSLSHPELYWKLAPYDSNNALCLRNYESNPHEGTMTFQTIGCYQKLYFLTFAGGVNKEETEAGLVQRTMTTTVYYSTGDPDVHTFEFLDCAAVKAERRAYQSNIYSSGFLKGSTQSAVYAAVSEMSVDTHRLIESIHFSYTGNSSTGIAIFAVTGMTAAIDAPSEDDISVSDIDANSFEACWEAIAEAASYRLDVAEDEDFQRILNDYNNLEVSGTTCQEVAGLLADNEYYWRVRSVDSDGGQSTSSAPRRVRTDSSEGPKTTNDTDHSLKDNDITPLLGSTTNIIINRTLYKDGFLNTLCLPFSMDAAAIAAGPLAGCRLYEFDHADKVGDAQLDIHMTETDAIEAGVPYLISWANTGEVLTSLRFNGVTITTDEGQTVGDGIRFVGNINTAPMTIDDHDNLFIGANNILYWPNTNDGLKGFRAHFEIPKGSPLSVPHNSPARIVMRGKTATDIEQTVTSNEQRSVKVMENGIMYFVCDGVRYNVLGQIVK
ncbi:MAG: hypothetical protein IJS00_04245 [Paludibacteraceae bacterium]|nr:hypothetical protein [Paludibacteraceae bacterium]